MGKTERTTSLAEPEATDEQLLLHYTQGDTEAFEQLVRRYRRELFNFLARFIGDPSLADDIFQETFLQVHLSAGGFDFSRRLKPWLFTIAANKARDAMRSRSRKSAVPLDAVIGHGEDSTSRFVDLMPAQVPPPSENIENLEEAEAVQTIVKQMPDNLRMVIWLSYFNGFAYKDIAEMLKIPLGTVKSRLHMAVQEFARRWKARFGTGDNGE